MRDKLDYSGEIEFFGVEFFSCILVMFSALMSLILSVMN